MKTVITSDGTIAGTTVKVDGTTLTEEENVVSVNFLASVRYSSWVRFSYSTREENEDGSVEITTYEYSSPDEDVEPDIRRIVRPAGLSRAIEEDEAELLISTRTVGDKFTEPVIDKAHVRPGHERAMRELQKDRKYKVIDTSKDDDGEDDDDGSG